MKNMLALGRRARVVPWLPRCAGEWPRRSSTLLASGLVLVMMSPPPLGITPSALKHGATYFTVMHQNLNALRHALGCR